MMNYKDMEKMYFGEDFVKEVDVLKDYFLGFGYDLSMVSSALAKYIEGVADDEDRIFRLAVATTAEFFYEDSSGEWCVTTLYGDIINSLGAVMTKYDHKERFYVDINRGEDVDIFCDFTTEALEIPMPKEYYPDHAVGKLLTEYQAMVSAIDPQTLIPTIRDWAYKGETKWDVVARLTIAHLTKLAYDDVNNVWVTDDVQVDTVMSAIDRVDKMYSQKEKIWLYMTVLTKKGHRSIKGAIPYPCPARA